MAWPYPEAGIEWGIRPGSGIIVCGGGVTAVCEAAGEYRPRHPEESVLYGVVAGHLETFLRIPTIVNGHSNSS